MVGGVWAAIRAVTNYRAGRNVYQGIRSDFGRALLLGLEVLVAADIVKTVSVATTLDNVVILGILVLVRTLLSFSLDVGSTVWRPGADARWRRRSSWPRRASRVVPRDHPRRMAEAEDLNPRWGFKPQTRLAGGRHRPD